MNSRRNNIIKYSIRGFCAGAVSGAGVGSAIGAIVWFAWVASGGRDCEALTAVGCENPCNSNWSCTGAEVTQQISEVSATLSDQKLKYVMKLGASIGAGLGATGGIIAGILYALCKNLPVAVTQVQVPSPTETPSPVSIEHSPPPSSLHRNLVIEVREPQQTELELVRPANNRYTHFNRVIRSVSENNLAQLVETKSENRPRSCSDDFIVSQRR